MATPEAMDVLLQEAENNGISLDGNPDPTAADVAVQVYLKDKELLERKHAEQYLMKPRSFEYFQTDTQPIPKFKPPTAKRCPPSKRTSTTGSRRRSADGDRGFSFTPRRMLCGFWCATAIH